MLAACSAAPEFVRIWRENPDKVFSCLDYDIQYHCNLQETECGLIKGGKNTNNL